MFTADISGSQIADKGPYIYCICCLELKVVYVGQTFSGLGALGRLNQHVSQFGASNTFMKRIEAHFGYMKPLSNLMFGAVLLSDRKEFWGDSRDYREAVEGLVMYRLLNEIVDANINLKVISRTRRNSYAKLKFVVDESENVISEVIPWISRLVD